MLATSTKIHEKLKLLAEKEAHWKALEDKMKQCAEVAESKIVLDIGM